MQVKTRLSPNYIEIAEYRFERVQKFRYLVAVISENNEEKEEMQNRILLANKAYFSLLPFLKNRDIHKETKFVFYKTLIRPVLIYGCETWTMTKSSANALDIFERKRLRRILRPVHEGERWRQRFNQELYSRYKELAVSEEAKKKMMKILGEAWRTRWKNSMVGRKTYEYIDEPDFVIRNKWFRPNQVMIQYLTGHGEFQSYLKRIGKRNNDDCACGKGRGSPEHEIWECEYYGRERKEYMKKYMKIDVINTREKRSMIETKEKFEILEDYLNQIYSLKRARC